MSFKFKVSIKWCNKFPFLSQCLQSGALMGMGDFIAQKFVEKRKLDYVRTTQFAGVGLVFVGPSLVLWYRTLEKKIGSGSVINTVKKVAVDQLLFAPVFISLVLGVVYTTQTYSLLEAKKKVSHTYRDVLINNYKFWPAVQFLNFFFVPVQYQVATVQSMAILWNTYLSWKMNQ